MNKGSGAGTAKKCYWGGYVCVCTMGGGRGNGVCI